MRINSKGQVTIPLRIREKLGLRSNTEVLVQIVGNDVRIRKVPGTASRGERLIAHLKGRGTVRRTDEILALMRR